MKYRLPEIEDRISRMLDVLAGFTATPGCGVTRFPFTPEAKAACDFLVSEMEDAGLKVRLDNSGSVVGRLEGEVPDTVMIGSHLDSVMKGGAYDGIAGAVCAIELARILRDSGVRPYYSMEFIATNDEEGSRFNSGLFSPKVMLGKLSVDDIRGFKDRDGISVYDAMRDFGLDPDGIADHVRRDIRAFIEIHIEQGPVLENEKKEIGIVDTIVGIQRFRITVHGRTDHIGTAPMNCRHDALDGACNVISAFTARARSNPPAVATVGKLDVSPNIINIVPETVSFTVDYRGTTPEMLSLQREGLISDLERVCKEFGLSYEMTPLLDVAPVDMDSRIKKLVEASCMEHVFSFMHLVSGAGHDAQVFGAEMPAAMVFVPSIGGRSHCPEEKSDAKHLAMATVAVFDAVISVNREKIF